MFLMLKTSYFKTAARLEMLHRFEMHSSLNLRIIHEGCFLRFKYLRARLLQAVLSWLDMSELHW